MIPARSRRSQTDRPVLAAASRRPANALSRAELSGSERPGDERPGSERPGGKRRGTGRREARQGFIFALPFLIGFAIFYFVPIVVTLYLSFTEFNILQSPKWIGLENYTRAFGDERFYKSLGTTFYLTFIGVPIGLGFGLATAMILNLRRMPARGFARALAYVPAIIPVVVTAYLFRWILNGRHGLLNTVLGWFGISAPNWLLDPTWMRPAVILISLWAVGGTTVIYLAALRSVPTDLYEAAELDGCGPVRRFIHVTWPSILPVTVFQLIVGLLANLQAFDVPYLLGSGDFNMTIGGPGETWLTYAIYIYHVAFGYFRMGYAAALAWLLFLIALVLTVIILRLTREVDNAE